MVQTRGLRDEGLFERGTCGGDHVWTDGRRVWQRTRKLTEMREDDLRPQHRKRRNLCRLSLFPFWFSLSSSSSRRRFPSTWGRSRSRLLSWSASSPPGCPPTTSLAGSPATSLSCLSGSPFCSPSPRLTGPL